MAKVTYVLAQGENSAGESQVNFRVYVSRELRVRVPSGIWVDRKRWGKKNDINIPNIPGEERDALLAKRAKLKELVDVIETSVEAADDKSTVTREWLEKLIRRTLRPKTATSVEEKKIGFFPLTDEYLATHKLSESRVKHFNVLVRTLKRYELYRKLSNRRFVLDVHTVSPTTLDDFGAFLMKEPDIFDEHPELYDEVPYARPKVRKNLPVKRGPYLNAAGETVIPGRPKERGMNYVSDMLIRLRSFYVWLNDNGHTYNDPFKQYKIAEIVYGTPIYITTDERKQLAEADMGDDKQLETQRDIFVFQCMIGCRVSDLYKMTYANIIGDCIEYVPRKTRDDRVVTVSVPLIGAAKELIRKYLDENRGTLFPFISEQKYNAYIKAAFRKAGLTRMVTTIDQRTRQNVQVPICDLASSHMARRTFIGNVYKSVKDPAIVGAMSGHKDGSRAFARYRDIDMDIKRDAVSVLE